MHLDLPFPHAEQGIHNQPVCAICIHRCSDSLLNISTDFWYSNQYYFVDFSLHYKV